MGWWEEHDGTVIGDGPADIVGGYIDSITDALRERYPAISRDQVLHTIAFCSGYLKQFDEKVKGEDWIRLKSLVVMTPDQRDRWMKGHKTSPDMSKRIAPDTELQNVYNPFTGDVV